MRPKTTCKIESKDPWKLLLLYDSQGGCRDNTLRMPRLNFFYLGKKVFLFHQTHGVCRKEVWYSGKGA